MQERIQLSDKIIELLQSEASPAEGFIALTLTLSRMKDTLNALSKTGISHDMYVSLVSDSTKEFLLIVSKESVVEEVVKNNPDQTSEDTAEQGGEVSWTDVTDSDDSELRRVERGSNRPLFVSHRLPCSSA